MKHWLCDLIVLLGTCFTCGAMPLSPAAFQLPNQDQPAAQKVEFPALTVPAGKRVILSFNARAVTPTFGGWNNLLAIRVNGNLLDTEGIDGKVRLLYRGSEMLVKPNKKIDWWHNSRNQALLVVFAPESATTLDPVILSPRNCGFNYSIDVSDVVNRAGARQNNCIEFQYLMTSKSVNGRKLPLALRDLKIEFMDAAAADKVRPAPAHAPLKTADSMPLLPANFQLMNQDQLATQKVEFPAVKVPAGKRVILAFNARAITAIFGGWNNNLKLRLNGKTVEPEDAAGKARLLYRGSEMSIKPNKKASWWSDRNSGWLLMFAPAAASTLDPDILSPRDCGYEYAFDVTDLVNTAESQAGNRLDVVYLLNSRAVNGRQIPLEVRNLRLEFLSEAQTDQARSGAASVASARLSCPGTVTLSPAELRMPNQDQLSARNVEFPAVKVANGKRVILAFNARVVTPVYAGWNNLLKIRVNGKTLETEDVEGKTRLLFRGNLLRTSLPKEGSRDWWRSARTAGLMMMFAPENATESGPRILSPRECGFEYAIDISDVVNRLKIGADDRVEANDPNRIEFVYLLNSRDVDGKKMPLLVRDLRLEFMDEAAADKARSTSGAAAWSRVPRPAVATLHCGKYTLEASADGAMALVTPDKERFYVDSQFSYPNKPAMKFNFFGEGTSRADWKVSVRANDARSFTITGTGKTYSVTRTVTAGAQRFEVRDVIKNASSTEKLGIAFGEIFSGEKTVRNAVRLAGQKPGMEPITFFSSSNPSVWVRGTKSGFGMVYEDTISRAQLQLNMRGGRITAGTIGCGLAPNAELERDWAIYPVPEGDYFGLINRIRRDWGVNFTIPGWFRFSSYGWGENPDSHAGVRPIRRWFQYYYHGNSPQNGAHLSPEEYVADALQAIAALRQQDPGVKVIANLETNLIPFDCRQVPWGNEIRQQTHEEGRNAPGIQYGQFFSPELSRKIEAVTPLADSLIRDADGNVMYDNMYPEKPYIHLMVQPELNNARGRHMIEQIDFLLDNLPLDGIYFDQIQPYIIGGFSDNRWDGHTVELNEAGEITKLRYSYAITGAAGRAAILRHVMERGKIAVTNGQPMSREEQKVGWIAFQEMENDPVNPLAFLDEKPPEFRWQSISHLGCPLALGIRPRKYIDTEKRPNLAARLQIKGVITALRNGLVYAVYIADMPLDGAPDAGSLKVFENMFPFTPVELHDGYVIGKERTITARSGEFTVGGAKPPRMLHFDNQGVMYKTCDWKVSGQPGAWKVAVKLNDWNEIGILIPEAEIQQ